MSSSKNRNPQYQQNFINPPLKTMSVIFSDFFRGKKTIHNIHLFNIKPFTAFTPARSILI